MSRINDFLTEAGVFYMATVDGNQPKLRPLGAHMIMDDKLMFAIGDFKDVYKQLQVNPLTEIVACNASGKWLRYTGKVVFESDPKYAQAVLEAAPDMKNIYNDVTGYQLKMFHMEEATAVLIYMMGEGEPIE